MDKMNKDWIIGVLVVVVLVFIGLFFSGRKETLAPTTNTETGKMTVESGNAPSSQNVGGTSQTPTSKPASQTASAPATTGKVTVLYTDRGFEPSIVITKQGQVVEFKNESGEKMWVASDAYPTNSIYPAFNQKGSVSRGGTYQFIFTKTGTWTYHNDLRPIRRASVVVKYE